MNAKGIAKWGGGQAGAGVLTLKFRALVDKCM